MTANPNNLLPLTVLLPLVVAALILAGSHWLHPRITTLLAITTAMVVAGMCGLLAHRALGGAPIQWFGGWTPESSGIPGVVLGISFIADPASAGVAAFAGILFASSLLFAWGFFDEVHSHFEILMLFFLAAIVGFCLTHDVFNMFVWFELMSVAAFALTAYPLSKSSLEGAFNFTIVNALGSFLMLAGVGLLYARTGTLDFQQMSVVVASIKTDPVVSAGFCLIGAALLTKGAIVPFHLWLSDAHAVAPSPVSVIFSGIMVSVALFLFAKLAGQVFAGDPTVSHLVHFCLPWFGAATALVGGAMAWAQRHLKRLLAFSTIAHLGIMLIGACAVLPSGSQGFLAYLVGHGLVKAALFMLAGILLSFYQSADEIVLYGRAKALWPAGVAMAVAGLLLGGFPLGVLHEATDAISASQPSLSGAIVLASGLTGAAVLRAAGRIFFGISGAPGPEITAPTEREREKGARPLGVMLIPCAVLLLLALVLQPLAIPFAREAASSLASQPNKPFASVAVPLSFLVSYAPIVITLVLFFVALIRERATRRLARLALNLEFLPFRGLQYLHSGLIADYVTWMMVGLTALVVGLSL